MIIVFLILIVLIMSWYFLNSFRWYQRILIMLFLIIGIASGSYGLTVHGISLYTKFHDVANGSVFLFSMFFTTIVYELILLPVFSFIIDRYNVGKIGCVKFVTSAVITILIFTVFNIVIYL